MFKKTKIVATISDKRCDVPFLKKMHKAGMDVVRLNTAHMGFNEAVKVISNVREVSEKIAILVDTKGPEVRTTMVDEPILVKKGDLVNVYGKPEVKSTSKEFVCVSYPDIVNDLNKGNQILIDDGALELKVVEKKEDHLVCTVENDGKIESRKSINVPGASFKLPSLTQKDRDFVVFAIQQKIDFIAHSFVRNKQDVLDIQAIIDKERSPIKIIAKIENQEGVDNIDSILDVAYGVMVARGDLAIEIPYEKIPGVQRMLVKKCIAKRKPVIIATQMLHSMINNPRPTRAEVNDIASAVYTKADAIMLSGETAYGAYPLEAVETMAKVATEVEKSRGDLHEAPTAILTNERSAYLTKMAVEASVALDAKAIIADSTTGSSIRNMAGFRGRRPIYAFCYNKTVVRQLGLSFGIFAQYLEQTINSQEFVHKAMNKLLEEKKVKENDLVIIIAGNFGTKFGKSFIEISPVEKLLESGD